MPVYAAVPAWDVRASGVVARALRRLGPRPVLHIQFQAGAFDLGGTVHLLPTWLRAALPRARVVTTFHDFLAPYLFPKAGPLRLGANRLLARTSHAAIFTEPADLALAGPGVRGHVVPIGSNVDPVDVPAEARATARRRLGADAGAFLVGYFGFLNRSKGVAVLLRAVRQLVETGRPVRLALLGAETGASDPTDLAEARAVRDLIERLGLRERVVATGYLEPGELAAALAACDAVALPFLDGASPRRGTLMAAIAHGVPIVTTYPQSRAAPASPGAQAPPGAVTDAGPQARASWRTAPGYAARGAFLEHGETVLLVPPDDHAALAAALARLADDPALRATLAGGAAALAPRIAWPSIAETTEAIYAAVLADAPGAAIGSETTASLANEPGSGAP